MQLVGIAFCPLDAPNIVRQNAKVLDGNGGENLIAKMYDYLESKGLISTGNFADHLDKVYELDVREKF
jgi:3-deoxy-D-manno-octulosonate 8-phosphate phosphatase KdsC-like HAD superfamily phosphatase